MAVLLVACFAVESVAAQGGGDRGSPAKEGPATETNAPSLELSQSQREAIYQSISNRQSKKDTAPIGFRAAVGAHVPDAIALEPLPKTVAELVPKIADYQYAFVANQVLIVEPKSRTVVEVIH